MDNSAYQPDSTANGGADPPPPYSSQQFSLVREEMETLRSKLEPGVYNAVLNHGTMPRSDMYKLFFLIAFPTFFFFLSIILMAADE